ncbi:MAG: alpha-D-ribose 1-methylphosphonate 5-phosphate C-P-lyase PhnJ [Chloroflexota bacterium]|nr:alpha-D-ribose 1-methylphosphonate 5-phosphate C-P-lyase PhnJ [Chloroflexota bacterium]
MSAPAPTLSPAAVETAALPGYNYAFLDELSKKAIRRATLKAVAIPGYQVPFGSRELPIARGWGTGGLQLTLSLIGPGDVVKVIDQGADDSVNAVNIRRLIERTAPDVTTTTETAAATIIQSRHRIPELKLRADQIMIYQVPLPEPLRVIERREAETRRMHGEADYSRMWVALYEDIVRNGRITRAAGYPVLVHHRHIMSPSPVPRWDLPPLHMAENLSLYGAGREKRIYAIPPFTDVAPLAFDDYPFAVEAFPGRRCALCGSETTFLVPTPDEHGQSYDACSDTDWCAANRQQKASEA